MAITFSLRVLAPIINLFHKKRIGSGKKILFFEPFFPNNAGYEYRSNKWKEYLEKEGFIVEIKSVLNEDEFQKLTSKKNLLSFHFTFIYRRFIQVLWSIGKFDVIIVRRALLLFNDYGDLFLDKLLLKLHSNVILDYDDDLASNIENSGNKSVFGKILFENRYIFYEALKLYPRLIAGSEYLKHLAINLRAVNAGTNILVLPTCVDYLKYPNKIYESLGDTMTLGWIGSNGNQKYLDTIVNELNMVKERFNIKLLVISGVDYSNESAKFEIQNVNWNLQNEVKSLMQIDVGIMPLPDNKTSRAKCGFKLIQYMGLGIVSVANSITTNSVIIEDDLNGFLVDNKNVWNTTLSNVIKNWDSFPSISKKAREKIANSYSFEAHIYNFKTFLNANLN